MDPVQSAKTFIRQFERLEDLDMMANARSGEARRTHDFVRVDLPLMLDVAQGRDPRARTDLDARQKALLELSPADMSDRINSDMETARRVLGWNAPFAKDETKDFILGKETFTHELRNDFVAKQEMHRDADRSASYVNSPESPLDPEMFELVRSQEARNGYYRPGDSVIATPADRQPDEDPFSFPSKKVEEVMLSRVSENSATYYSSYRLEGESDYRKKSELLDPRGTQHSYGVIAEGAGRLYYVETESPFGPVEPENMVAREIAGIERTMVDRIEAEIHDDRSDALQNGLYTQEDIHGPRIAPQNMREVLGFDSKTREPIAGEFTYHGVDGPNEKVGPIVIEANSWGSGTSSEERAWAEQAIRRHLEKHEFPQMSISEQVHQNKQGSMVHRGEPTVETVRHGNQQAAIAASMGQGY